MANAPLICAHCGATVTPPDDPDATFAVCGHCQHPNPLSAEWVEMRQRQQSAIDRRQAEHLARTEKSREERRARRLHVFGILGFLLVLFGIIAFTVGKDLIEADAARKQQQMRLVELNEKQAQRLAQLDPLLSELRSRHCVHEVTSPRAVLEKDQATLQMNAGGNCLHVVASAPGKLEVSVTAPSGAPAHHTDTDGSVDFEYCPKETGEHRFQLNTTPAEVFGYAMVDCPAPRAKYKDDPNKNGLARVQRRMKELTKLGCTTVLMAPKTSSGERSVTATIQPGKWCAMIVAATGFEDNPLTTSFTTPLGEPVPTPRPAIELEIGHCAKVAGPHVLRIQPKTLDFYTVAGLDCPRSVAEKR